MRDTDIHRIELLITLDYLLKYSDEAHPAKQLDIVEYAKKFNLGFDVKRQRIADTLHFLEDLCNNYPEEIPFILDKAKGGKYYIESKFYFNEIDIVKILAAIKNDRYTKDLDTDYLVDKLLDLFTNTHNRDEYINKMNILLKNVNKINSKELNLKNLELLMKAFKENKAILIKENDIESYYRVYMFKEYNNKLCVFLVPFDRRYKLKLLVKPIDELIIPNKRENLIEDEGRNLDDYFKECFKDNIWIPTIDEYTKAHVLPTKGGILMIVNFYIKNEHYDFLCNKFKEFFNYDLTQVCHYNTTLDEIKNYDGKDVKEIKNGDYHFFNIVINDQAFMNFCFSIVDYDNSKIALDYINLMEPVFLKHKIKDKLRLLIYKLNHIE